MPTPLIGPVTLLPSPALRRRGGQQAGDQLHDGRLLPQPEGPTTATNSPRSMPKVAFGQCDDRFLAETISEADGFKVYEGH